MIHRLPRICALTCAVALLAGCGYIGEPLPPLMNIPLRVSDLSAVERGDKIIVQFNVPTLTTEGKTVTQLMHLDLRFGPALTGKFDAARWASSATPITGGAFDNGIGRYQVPAAPWIGKSIQIAVKVSNPNHRDDGWSDPVTLAVVPAPDNPRGLRAEPAPQGVRLTWQSAANSFAVFRRNPDEKTFGLLSQCDKPDYTDPTAEYGKTYIYVVQSLAKAGEGQAQSDISNEFTVTPQDTFPPAAPAGLTGVPSTATIELVWERNTEPNVSGYRVYRALGNGPFEQLPDSPQLPSYSDHKIESGKVYRYAVSAVKRSSVEGPRSAPVEVTAP